MHRGDIASITDQAATPEVRALAEKLEALKAQAAKIFDLSPTTKAAATQLEPRNRKERRRAAALARRR